VKTYYQLILFVIMLNACKTTETVKPLVTGDMFPKIEAQTLEKKKIIFPDDLKGKVSVLATGFSQEAQEPINTWTDYLLKNHPDMAYYEVPIGNQYWAVVSTQVDNAMRDYVPKELHSKIATYYGKQHGRYVKQFEVTNRYTCYVFLLDTEGRILYKAVGPVTPSIQSDFEKAIVQLSKLK
jgi:ATP10 protein